MKTYRVKDFNSSARPHLKACVVWTGPDKKREKKFFPTKGEAKAWAQIRETELLNQGREAVTFSSALRVMALECEEILKPFGKTIRDATNHFAEYLAKSSASVPIPHASNAFIAHKRGRNPPLSRRYMLKIEKKMARFSAAHHPGMLVSDVTHAMCEDYLASLNGSPRTVREDPLLLFEFFKWCMQGGRKWCSQNPWSEVELPKVGETKIGVVTPQDLEKMLNSAPGDMLPFIAIGAFAGLRTAELQRLDWREVDLQEGIIEVMAENSKTATRRPVKILPALRQWIEPFARDSGPVSPPYAYGRLGPLAKRAGMEEWPVNALRHSYASYHLAMFRDAAALALEMGHTTTKMIFRHYRKVVRESQAIQFWNVLPSDVDALREKAKSPIARTMIVKREKEKETKFPKGWHVVRYGYKKSASQYAGIYGVSKCTIATWQLQGKPLDDPAAMERLSRGEYEHTLAEHVRLYKQPVRIVKIWRTAGWPLDMPERVYAYLEYRAEVEMLRERCGVVAPSRLPAKPANVIRFLQSQSPQANAIG